MNSQPKTVKQQKGVITILTVMLLGIALTVATMGTIHAVNSTQGQSVSLHAATQSQSKAWTGARIVNEYFTAIATDEDAPEEWEDTLVPLIENATVNTPVALATGVSGLTANVVGFAEVDVDDGEGGTETVNRVVTDIAAVTGAGTRAEARSIVRVVYQVKPGVAEVGGPGPGLEAPEAVVTFNYDLNLGGDIDITSPEDTEYVINVRGQLNASSGNSITGVDVINATDSIEIGSGSSFGRLNSNGDVKITGSVSGEKEIFARGNVCMTGGTSAGYVRSNGFVYGTGSASFSDIEAGGNSDYDGNFPKCDSYSASDNNGEEYAINFAGNNNVDSILAKGSVYKNGGGLDYVKAEGDFVSGYGSVSSGEITGQVCYNSNCPPPTWKQSSLNISANQTLTVDIEPVELIVVETTTFDAYVYQSSANYVLYYEGGQKRISVKNVSGISDGDYYLGSNTSISGPKYDRICENSSCSGISYPFCKGYSDYNSCFSYNSGSETWSMNGTSLSPGIVFIEGNLVAGTGEYYNTFISTGNISTSGSHKTISPNFAGYSGGVFDNGTWINMKGICTNSTFNHHPTQFCNFDDMEFDPEGAGALGDYAYMAGSLDGENYQGGDISLGASTLAFGSVLSGDTFNSGGSTTVYGYITAQGELTSTTHQMGGSTDIIVEDLPSTYTPSGGIPGGPGTTVPGEPGSVTLLWSRYL